MQAIDEALRATPAYKQALKDALETYPTLNPSLFDMALACAYGNPHAHLDESQVQTIEGEDQSPVGEAVVRVGDARSVTQGDGDSSSPQLTEVT